MLTCRIEADGQDLLTPALQRIASVRLPTPFLFAMAQISDLRDGGGGGDLF